MSAFCKRMRVLKFLAAKQGFVDQAPDLRFQNLEDPYNADTAVPVLRIYGVRALCQQNSTRTWCWSTRPQGPQGPQRVNCLGH